MTRGLEGSFNLKLLVHGPRGCDLRELPSIVGGQDIPGLNHLLTNYAGMRHVQVNFCVSLYLGLVRHGLATLKAGIPSALFLLYHSVHYSVQF